MDDYKIIVEQEHQTVMAHYDVVAKAAEGYQSEAKLEEDLIKQLQINIGYILGLVQQYHDTNCQDKEIIVKIRKQIDASPDMRDKRDLIEKFIQQMTPEKGTDVGNKWEVYIEQEKRKQLSRIIEEEHLKAAETEDFMERAFADGYVTETGTGITNILPPSNPFLPESGEKKQTVIDKLKAYLSRFSNMLSDDRAGLDVFRARKLESVDDDKEVRDFVFNLLHMNDGISDFQIQRELTERFGEEYPGMTLNDWRHIIEDYTSMVREAMNGKAKEIVLQLKKAASPENEKDDIKE